MSILVTNVSQPILNSSMNLSNIVRFILNPATFMVYELKFKGAEQDDGSIDLERLALLSSSILNISKGALQIRLLGISTERGRPLEMITNALKIKLTKLKKGSTVLQLECETFGKTMKAIQGDFFKPDLLDELPKMTPMSLFISTYQEALSDGEKNYLDKPLLKSLKDFRKVLLDKEEITVSNRGSVKSIVLKREDFNKIQMLEESTPDPQQVIVNGIVELLQYSKSRITIQTNDGVMNGHLSDDIDPNHVSQFWGKEITIAGTAFYKPNGRITFIEVERLFAPQSDDAYFSNNAKKENVEQQIQKHLLDRKYNNRLNEIVGKWPGEESIEEILTSLD